MQPATLGRIVHYFPARQAEYPLDGEKYAATVVSPEPSETPTLSIFTANGHTPLIVREAVPHRDHPNRKEDSAYWDWPPRA